MTHFHHIMCIIINTIVIILIIAVIFSYQHYQSHLAMVPNNTLELKESFKSFLVDTKLLVTQSEIVKSLVGFKLSKINTQSIKEKQVLRLLSFSLLQQGFGFACYFKIYLNINNINNINKNIKKIYPDKNIPQHTRHHCPGQPCTVPETYGCV